MRFTTRPELSGTFGMVTSTHWIASAVGMRMLERGGNAFDAAVATGLTLQVVEPHLNGPLGDMPALIWPAGEEAPTVICGQGTAPAGATIAHYRSEGLAAIPGSGLLATVIPGAFDAWMLMLRDHGTLPLRAVMEPAVHYARAGHPLLPRVADTIAGLAAFFEAEWPSSAAVWMPGGAVPEAGALFCNPELAAAWTRLLAEAEAAGTDRVAQIEAARGAFYRGFVAEAVDSFLRKACLMDGGGARRRGVLSGQDMAGWQASCEPAVTGTYHAYALFKPGFWSQGPVLLQALKLLEGMEMPGTGSAGFVHLVTEAMKLSFADREAYYGDAPEMAAAQRDLLGAGYTAARRGLIDPGAASMTQRPGALPGLEGLAEAAIARAARTAGDSGPGGGEPTMSHLAAHLSQRRGDTVHLDVADRWGNMVSATPSGGWLQSSPVVPGLGMPLNSRAQMFWLDEGLPTSLAPGRRPRTTLSPSMARGPGGERLAFGTPGGDQQDQWQLVFLLRLAQGTRNLQAAIDAPLFHSAHFTSSFAPRVARPGALIIEPGWGVEVTGALRALGHGVEVAPEWSVGRLTAAAREAGGRMRAAATPRLMQAYAVGR